jgi:hypothetical protein
MAQPLDVDHPYQFRQTHNFALAGDVDWVKFQAVAGRKYRIETTNLGTACRTNVNLYGSDGTSLLVTSSNTMSPKPGSQIVWTCTQSGTFYVSVRHQDPLAQGPATNYGQARLFGSSLGLREIQGQHHLESPVTLGENFPADADLRAQFPLRVGDKTIADRPDALQLPQGFFGDLETSAGGP